MLVLMNEPGIKIVYGIDEQAVFPRLRAHNQDRITYLNLSVPYQPPLLETMKITKIKFVGHAHDILYFECWKFANKVAVETLDIFNESAIFSFSDGFQLYKLTISTKTGWTFTTDSAFDSIVESMKHSEFNRPLHSEIKGDPRLEVVFKQPILWNI